MCPEWYDSTWVTSHSVIVFTAVRDKNRQPDKYRDTALFPLTNCFISFVFRNTLFTKLFLLKWNENVEIIYAHCHFNPVLAFPCLFRHCKKVTGKFLPGNFIYITFHCWLHILYKTVYVTNEKQEFWILVMLLNFPAFQLQLVYTQTSLWQFDGNFLEGSVWMQLISFRELK